MIKLRSISILLVMLLFTITHISAQGKYFTKSGKIEFFSATPAEDIKALNKNVTTILDVNTGNMQFSVLMKAFQFKKGLMQEHFNKDYVESDKFPQAEFKGQIVNNSEVNYTKNGSNAAKVKGMLTIHGVTKEIETTGTLTVKDGKIGLNAVFNVLVADFKISVPAVVRENIAKKIKVTIDCNLEPLPQ